MKTIHYGPTILIDGADATTLSIGETVTFINWGNLVIKSINKDKGGQVVSIDATPNLENTVS